MIQRLETSARMSKVVIHNETIYLCGQVGNPDGSIAEQTQECLRRVEALLTKASSGKNHILQAIVWLADMKEFHAMNEVWDSWIPDGCAPARACGEAKLAHPDLKVEIIVTAAVSNGPRQRVSCGADF